METSSTPSPTHSCKLVTLHSPFIFPQTSSTNAPIGFCHHVSPPICRVLLLSGFPRFVLSSAERRSLSLLLHCGAGFSRICSPPSSHLGEFKVILRGRETTSQNALFCVLGFFVSFYMNCNSTIVFLVRTSWIRTYLSPNDPDSRFIPDVHLLKKFALDKKNLPIEGNKTKMMAKNDLRR